MSFSLDLCSCKRGFFTLRDCANQATTSCSSCTRRICDQHVADGSVCVECAARQEEASATGEPLDPVGVDPTRAAVRYRTRWYRTGGYSPVWWGTSDSYWSSSDYRWYDEGSNDDDDDGGGFDDS